MAKQLAARVTSLDKSKIEDGFKNIEVPELWQLWCLRSLGAGHAAAVHAEAKQLAKSGSLHLQTQEIEVPEPKEGQALVKMTLRCGTS
jgi:hypothetical protein